MTPSVPTLCPPEAGGPGQGVLFQGPAPMLGGTPAPPARGQPGLSPPPPPPLGAAHPCHEFGGVSTPAPNAGHGWGGEGDLHPSRAPWPPPPRAGTILRMSPQPLAAIPARARRPGNDLLHPGPRGLSGPSWPPHPSPAARCPPKDSSPLGNPPAHTPAPQPRCCPDVAMGRICSSCFSIVLGVGGDQEWKGGEWGGPPT